MKIDADAGGTVDWWASGKRGAEGRDLHWWRRGHAALRNRARLFCPPIDHRDEFTNFMFLERAQQAADEGSSENWRLFPQVAGSAAPAAGARGGARHSAQSPKVHWRFASHACQACKGQGPPRAARVTPPHGPPRDHPAPTAPAKPGQSPAPTCQEFRDKNEHSCYHRDQVDRVYYVQQVDKYVTCGRDGSFRCGGRQAGGRARTRGAEGCCVPGARVAPLACEGEGRRSGACRPSLAGGMRQQRRPSGGLPCEGLWKSGSLVLSLQESPCARLD
jgi:hypothetical protein